MKLGIDIDDVIYKTSEMLHTEGAKLLQALGYSHKPDATKYSLAEMFKVSDSELSYIDKHLPWNSYEYLNSTAIREIKNFVSVNSDVKLCIVTKRPRYDAEIITKYLSESFYLNIKDIIIVPIEENKSTYCDTQGIDILVDDCSENIQDILDNSKSCKAVLIATPNIQHNRPLADTYPYTVTDWLDFSSVVLNAFNS